MDLEVKISNWLEKQGYPLEMFVSQKFRKYNFLVSQSIYYYDDELRKNREIDIKAYKGTYIEGSVVSIEYVIECKSSQKPWLLFSAKRNNPIDIIYDYLYSKEAFPIILNLSAENLQEKIFPFDFKYIGYGFTQAFSSGNDIAFKAISTLSKYSNSVLKSSNDKEFIDCKLIMPVLVIDSPLFEVYLTNNYVMKTVKREIGFLSLPNLIPNSTNVPIIIVTKNYIDEFCKIAKIISYWLIRYCKENLTSIQKEHMQLTGELNSDN